MTSVWLSTYMQRVAMPPVSYTSLLTHTSPPIPAPQPCAHSHPLEALHSFLGSCQELQLKVGRPLS